MAMDLQAQETRRKEFIMENQFDWFEEGSGLKARRVKHQFPLTYIAKELRISASRLSKFERGLPVSDARLIGAAYSMVLERHEKQLELRALADYYAKKGGV